MTPVLEVHNLVKTYGAFRAVDDVSFSVQQGQVIGLLGPNGAGKTTTIQVLLGVTLANGGTIKYFGMDFFKKKQACLSRINFASSFNTLQGRISVRENLIVFAELYGVRAPHQRITELAALFEIERLLPMKYSDLSQGQKTRVNIIKAFLNDPELVLFDEPTSSLDPDIADKLLQLIEHLKTERNLSIVYTSHDMAEVTRICDEVIFLDQGKIIAQDTPLALTKRIDRSELHLIFQGARATVEKVLKTHKLSGIFSNAFTVRIAISETLIPKVIFKLSEAGIWLTDISIKKPTLEDVFLEIARKSNVFSA